jgi:hypothetical protein
MERKLLELVTTIKLQRNVTLFGLFFCIVQLILVLIFPDLVPSYIKIWLIAIVGLGFVGIVVALIVSRNDPQSTVNFVLIAGIMSGIVIGITLTEIISKVKILPHG